jgi:hypothetical protein
MGFRGAPLPMGCPPADAKSPPDSIVLRLVPSNPAADSDFDSGAAQGKKKPHNCDLCRWSACSVFLDSTPIEKVQGLTKLPNLRHMKFIAYLKVNQQSGKFKPWDTDAEHLSLWMHDSFKPHLSIAKHTALS